MAVEFGVLGPLEARRDGVALDLGPPRQRMLLAYLLTSPNRPISVDRLAELLWGGGAPGQAIVSIQSWVSRLRRILEPVRATRTPSEILVTRSPGYLVVATASDLDALQFEDMVAAARRSMASAPDSTIDLVSQALSLWRGDAYADLVGGAAVAEAMRLEELCTSAHELRIEAQLTLGRIHEVVPDAMTHVDAHPLRDLAVRLAVLALVRAGRQPEALRTLDRARRARVEIGLSPSPELIQLEAAVLDHDPALLVPAAGSASPAARPSPIAVSAQPEPAADERTLVGRSGELARIGNMLGRQVAAVLLHGEPGIGKTRMAGELAQRWAAAHGARVAWGRCPDVSVPAPLWPMLELLQDLDVPPLADGTQPLAGDIGRTLLLDKAVRALRELPAQGSPVVLVVDDVQWADAESLMALSTLAVDPPENLALILTQRSTGTEPDLPALAALRRLSSVLAVEVGPLGAEDLHSLARNVIGAEPDARLVAAVHQRTAGNPFLAVELLRLLRDQRLGGGDGGGVPPVVQEVLNRRLLRLPLECRRALHVAAVQGVQFNLETVAELTGSTEDATLDLLEMAAAAGITEDHGSQWRFSHALVAEAVAAELSATRRARLHAQIAALLERSSNPDWSMISHHWLGARAVSGPAPALAALAKAEAEAARELAIDTALTLNEARLDLFASLDDRAAHGMDEMRAAVDRVNLTLVRLGFDVSVMRAALDRAQEIAAVHGDVRSAMHLIHGEAWASIFNGDIERGVILGEELLRLAAKTEDRDAQIVAHYDLAIISYQRGELRAAGEHLRQLALASPEDRARAYAPVFAADDDRDTFLDCIAASIHNLRTDDFEPLEQVWQNARTPMARLYASLFSSSLAALRGDYERASRHVVRLREASGQGEMQLYALYASWFGAVVEVAAGEPDPDTVRARRDELIGGEVERLGVLTFTGPARAILAHLFLLAGAPEDALAAAEEALRAPGTRYGDVFAWRTTAAALGMLGRHDEATSATREAQRLALHQGFHD